MSSGYDEGVPPFVIRPDSHTRDPEVGELVAGARHVTEDLSVALHDLELVTARLRSTQYVRRLYIAI